MTHLDTEDGKAITSGEFVGFLNLARGLVDLLDTAEEFCTPGHRMGRGYELFLISWEAYHDQYLIPSRS